MSVTISRSTCLLALSLSLAGCNLAPKYVRPASPVPEAAPTGPAYAPAAAGAIIPAETTWRDFFVDPRLQRVIDTALTNNRNLRIAIANIEQARAQFRGRQADLFPTLNANAGGTFQKSPFQQFGGAGGGSPAGRIDIYTASVGVSAWEIDLFGRVRNLSEAAQEQYFASIENRNAAQTTLIAETATAWLSMAADQERLRISRELEKLFGETLALTRARFDKGIASELEVRQAQTSYDQARSDIAQATTLVAQDQNALNLLAGTTVLAADLPGAMPEGDVTLANLPSDLPSDLLLRRPDIAAAEHQLRAANANIGAARAAFFPRISLTATLGTLSTALSGLFSSGSDTWSVAPSGVLPIFDFGRNSANLRGTRAQYDGLLATYERTIQTGFREVADALARRGTMGAQVEAQTSLRDSTRVSYRLAEARFRAGIDPFLTTLDSQRALYTAEQSLLATRLTRAANMVELYRAMGGGLR